MLQKCRGGDTGGRPTAYSPNPVAGGAPMNSYTTDFSVDEAPHEVIAAINNVRGWWSGDIEGSTDQLGAEFTYRYEDVHWSEQRITELVPGKKVVWLVLASHLRFVEDKTV